MKVREYLTNANWSKIDLEPGQCCLGAAIDHCYGSKSQGSAKVYREVVLAIGGDTLRPVSAVIDWNDDPERTWVDVQKLITDLDI